MTAEELFRHWSTLLLIAVNIVGMSLMVYFTWKVRQSSKRVEISENHYCATLGEAAKHCRENPREYLEAMARTDAERRTKH